MFDFLMPNKSNFSTLISSSLLAASVAFTWVPSALAITLGQNDVNSSFTVNFDGSVNEQNASELSAKAIFKLTSFNSTTAKFDILLKNTSTIDSRVSVLGFDVVDPNISNASSTGLFTTAVLDSSLPNQFGSIDVCFKEGQGNNCKGGTNGGVFDGQSGELQVTLNFGENTEKFTLDNFGVRYQSIGAPYLDDKNNQGSGTGSGTVEDVPEPLTILGSVMALGFGGFFKKEYAKKQKAKA